MQCNLDIPKISGLEDNQLTVGREFYLICKGDWPKDLIQEKLHFSGDETMKYALKMRGFEFRSPEEADIKVVSYLAGKVQIPQLILTDGVKTVDLGQHAFQVESVLPKPEAGGGLMPGQEQQQQPKPFGPVGPATIPVPILYWLVLVGAVVFVVMVVALRSWRFNQRRAMLQRLKEHDVAISPMQELHQSMRKLQRANAVFYGKEASEAELQEATKELSRMLKVYVSRRLSVPAFEWSERLILNDIRKYHPPVFAEYGTKLRTLFTEFKKAESPQAKLTANDVSQLAVSLRKTLEGVERVLNQAVTEKKGAR